MSDVRYASRIPESFESGSIMNESDSHKIPDLRARGEQQRLHLQVFDDEEAKTEESTEAPRR